MIVDKKLLSIAFPRRHQVCESKGRCYSDQEIPTGSIWSVIVQERKNLFKDILRGGMARCQAVTQEVQVVDSSRSPCTHTYTYMYIYIYKYHICTYMCIYLPMSIFWQKVKGREKKKTSRDSDLQVSGHGLRSGVPDTGEDPCGDFKFSVFHGNDWHRPKISVTSLFVRKILLKFLKRCDTWKESHNLQKPQNTCNDEKWHGSRVVGNYRSRWRLDLMCSHNISSEPPVETYILKNVPDRIRVSQWEKLASHWWLNEWRIAF